MFLRFLILLSLAGIFTPIAGHFLAPNACAATTAQEQDSSEPSTNFDTAEDEAFLPGSKNAPLILKVTALETFYLLPRLSSFALALHRPPES